MITSTRRSYDSEEIKKSQKSYFLLVIDHKPIGICTTFETAQACAKCYAEKYNAKEVGHDDVYIYEDSGGKHLISIEIIKRLKMPSIINAG